MEEAGSEPSTSKMRDPHIEHIRYDLVAAEFFEFESPQPLDCETPHFYARIENGVATVRPKEHYPSATAARDVIDPILRGWEIDHALTSDALVTFQYRDCYLIDRDPLPPAISPEDLIQASITIKLGSVTARADIVVVRKITRYPPPPALFEYNPDVEALWNRYQGYLKEREPLQAMAYFCLTVLEAQAPDGKRTRRERTGQHFQIDDKVLGKLGELTTKRGGPDTARKAGEWTPLSAAETEWIKRTIRLIIQRVGEVAPGRVLNQITMADLPDL